MIVVGGVAFSLPQVRLGRDTGQNVVSLSKPATASFLDGLNARRDETDSGDAPKSFCFMHVVHPKPLRAFGRHAMISDGFGCPLLRGTGEHPKSRRRRGVPSTTAHQLELRALVAAAGPMRGLLGLQSQALVRRSAPEHDLERVADPLMPNSP
ncbi:hypothetical protein MPLB_940009 [Mesorhizobium sp. ORS 3324]|nr:hypothetical protein MPLB_940009 [Mesorhizobium sp. ORS 3324]